MADCFPTIAALFSGTDSFELARLSRSSKPENVVSETRVELAEPGGTLSMPFHTETA
jgi:hypothetical protein